MAEAFTPLAATANKASAANTSSTTALNYPSGFVGGMNCRVVNDTDKTVFIEFGPSTVSAATATSIPVLAGITEIFGVNPRSTHVATIVTAGTATGSVYFTIGLGE